MNNLMKEFKDAFEIESGHRIDFRSDVFLENEYGAMPTFRYSFAEKVVLFAYNYFQEYIDENEDDYPMFSGWEYNLDMSIEKLRSTTLQSFIESFISDIENYKNYTE